MQYKITNIDINTLSHFLFVDSNNLPIKIIPIIYKVTIYLECIVQLYGKDILKDIKLISHAKLVISSIVYI